MKNLIIATCLLIGGVLPRLVSAETIPYSNSFETVGIGASITADATYSNYWFGNGQVSAIVTNLDYSNNFNTPYIGLPIAGAPQTKVLSFTDGLLTNTVDGAGQSMVYLDLMVQPTLQATDDLQTASVTGSQFAVAFTTNGVAVWHGIQTIDWATYTQKWSILNSAFSSTVSSGKWCRLTITLNYHGLPDFLDLGVNFNPMFQVKIDGQPLTSPYGYINADRASGTNGSWLSMASVTPSAMTALILNGNGMLDDLVVNSSPIPDYVTPTNFIPYGWLTFMGVVTNGASPSEMNAAEFGDNDGDGMLNWQEYIAGTDPTNSASKFMIVSQVVSNGFPHISWLSSVNARAPYRIESSTNLSSGNWRDESSTWATNGPAGTNVWTPFVAPTNNASFYRLQIR